MIVTLTANPSHDRTITLAGPLERGAVQRSLSEISQAGGKGVNITRASMAAGLPSVAVVPAAADDPFVQELTAAGIDCHPIAHSGTPRVNLTISEPDGTTTKINSPGDEVDEALLGQLTSALQSLGDSADWIVLAGSLPPGCPVGWYSELMVALRSAGTKIALDTSDEPLRSVFDRLDEAAPHLMKPNGEELASLTGGDPDELESDPVAAASAARLLIESGVETVLVTLGANGAVLVTADNAWHALPPPIEVLSTVGAGDASLFGYLLAETRGLPHAERLALSVAYGSAAASLPGTTTPQPSQVREGEVRVSELPDLSASST